MFLTSLASNLISAWFSLLLPSYRTWKALAHRPVSEPEIERWAMYWSIMGAFVAFEHTAEWLVSWLPFYWEFKILVLLYMSLPQTQGSTWIYQMFVNPYLRANEASIDSGIAAAKANIIAFVQSRFAGLWQSVAESATKAAANAVAQGQPGGTPANPIDVVKGLWNVYGSTLMSGLQDQGHAGAASLQRPVPSHASSSSSVSSQSSVSSNGSASSSSSETAYPEPYKV